MTILSRTDHYARCTHCNSTLPRSLATVLRCGHSLCPTCEPIGEEGCPSCMADQNIARRYPPRPESSGGEKDGN